VARMRRSHSVCRATRIRLTAIPTIVT
jgi:hypothetical protein